MKRATSDRKVRAFSIIQFAISVVPTNVKIQSPKNTGTSNHNNLSSEKESLKSEFAKENFTICSGYVNETAKIRRKFILSEKNRVKTSS